MKPQEIFAALVNLGCCVHDPEEGTRCFYCDAPWDFYKPHAHEADCLWLEIEKQNAAKPEQDV